MISSVCWPGVGTGPIRPGVFDILIVTPGKYISPATGSSILTSIWRSHRCGSRATSGIVRTGPTGTPASPSAAQISSTVCAAHHASIRARRASGPELPTSGASSPVPAPPSTRRMRRAAISRAPALMTT